MPSDFPNTLATTLSTMTRRVLARQSRGVVAVASIATLAIVSFAYFSRSQVDGDFSDTWTYNGAEQWDWRKLVDAFSIKGKPHTWDTVCHQAVAENIKVAVYDFTNFHEEVVGSILSSLNDTGVQTDMYRSNFRYNFKDITETFFPAHDSETFRRQDTIMPKLKAGEYDVLLMTSCDESWVQPQVLEYLETAEIPIICLHHEMWSFWKHRPRLLSVAKAGKLTVLTLGEHVRKLVKEENTLPWTEDGADGAFKWTDVPSEVFIPVFPLPPSIPLPSQAPRKIVPNDVAVLGELVENGRRDYGKLWRELIVAIQESPSAWGYRVSSGNGHFIPSTTGSDVQPFRVHLFGNRAKGFVIPPELETHVVVIHSGLDYVDYYKELSELDLVLPILGNNEYTRNRATAAFPAGIISRVPSLITPRILKSYNYLEPPAVVMHPDGTREVDVLAAMRRGEDPWTSFQSPDDAVAIPGEDRYNASWLLDSHLQRPHSTLKDWDWNGYVADIRAHNAKLLCTALLR